MSNHSKDPQVALQEALDAGYTAVHIEQGVPVLDRDLNLQVDLVAALGRQTFARWVTDGVVDREGAFAPRGLPIFDLEIGAPGRALVGGLEVSIHAPVRYGRQLDETGAGSLLVSLRAELGEENPLARRIFARLQSRRTELEQEGSMPSMPSSLRYWLDVWVESLDDSVDDRLANPDDVGSRTSTRSRPMWLLRRVWNAPIPAPLAGHAHMPIYEVPFGPLGLLSPGEPRDLRRIGLTIGADGRDGLFVVRNARNEVCIRLTFETPGETSRPVVMLDDRLERQARLSPVGLSFAGPHAHQDAHYGSGGLSLKRDDLQTVSLDADHGVARFAGHVLAGGVTALFRTAKLGELSTGQLACANESGVVSASDGTRTTATRVVGVVVDSGRGVALIDDAYAVAVAVAGRARCWVSAANGRVLVGDLLVPFEGGKARKANAAPDIGTVVGKALQSAPDDGKTEHLIDILVMLG